MQITTHYIVIIVAIAIILMVQIHFFIQTCRKLNYLSSIFPYVKNGANLSTIKDEDENITYIAKSPKYSSTLNNILDTINGYLRENRGAASDFHLIKDVVERNCDNVEEEISTLTPIPLYSGLIGTMIGILAGVSFLVLSGGITDLLSTNSASSGAGIVELLGGVALAMISSIFGIGLTTITSYLTKGAKTKLNHDKDKFFSWFQITLLPTMSSNVASVINALQHNLMNFNESFSSNIAKMDSALNSVSDTHKDQLELLKTIQGLGVHQMATANVKVLKEIQQSTSKFEVFNKYLHDVTTFLSIVQELNNKFGEQSKWTESVIEMGEFYKKENEQIAERAAKINRTIDNIDSTLDTALSSLGDSTSTQIELFKAKSDRLNVSFEESIEKITETKRQILESVLEDFTAAIKEQQQSMRDSLGNSPQILENLQLINSVGDTMESVQKLSVEHNEKLDLLICAIKELATSSVVRDRGAKSYNPHIYAHESVEDVDILSSDTSDSTPNDNPKTKGRSRHNNNTIDPLLRILIIISCFTIIIAAGFYVVSTVLNMYDIHLN